MKQLHRSWQTHGAEFEVPFLSAEHSLPVLAYSRHNSSEQTLQLLVTASRALPSTCHLRQGEAGRPAPWHLWTPENTVLTPSSTCPAVLAGAVLGTGTISGSPLPHLLPWRAGVHGDSGGEAGRLDVTGLGHTGPSAPGMVL